MVKVSVTKQSNYPVDAVSIKKKLAAFFADHGIVSDSEVSVAIVGEAKMLEIQKKFLKENPTLLKLRGTELHNVLSFTPTEVKDFVYPPDGTVHLGEIIVCYPQAVREAGEENMLTNEKVYELVEHGGLHLLGIHHEE